jgi:hypothetical protein
MPARRCRLDGDLTSILMTLVFVGSEAGIDSPVVISPYGHISKNTVQLAPDSTPMFTALT